MINEFTLGIAVMLFTGLLFGKIAKKLRIPNITGYLLGGLIIGPVLVNLVIPNFAGIIGMDLIKALSLVTEIELGFIAFTVGSEFKISYFKQVGLMPVIIAFAESLAAVVFITGGMLICGVPLYFALCMGAVGGATAPAATIMVIRQYKAKGELTQTLLSVVAIDDASALIFFGIAMAIVKSIISPGAQIAMTIVMPFIEIIGSIILGLAAGAILTFLIRFFKSRGNRLILVIAVLFLNIGVCIFLKERFSASFSSLLACMATGAVFCNTSKKLEDVMPLIENITPPLVVIFFILSGAGLEIGILTGMGVLLLVVYLVFRVSGKVFGTWASAKACKAPPKVKKWLGFGLLPQGGIAIGLSMIVMEVLKDVEDPVYNGQLVRVIVLCAVFISEIFGPLLCKFALVKSGEGQSEKRIKKRSKNQENLLGQSMQPQAELLLSGENPLINDSGQPQTEEQLPESQG